MQLQDLSYKLNNELINIDLSLYKDIKVSIEVFSLENVYTVPQGSYFKNGNTFSSNTLVWGDSEKIDGKASLRLKKHRDSLNINARAKLDKKIRSIKVRFDNLPLGKLISLSSKDKDVTEYGLHLRYPEGWRDLSHPLLVFQLEDGKYLYLRCLDKTVNTKQFLIRKVGEKMRIDVTQEQEGSHLRSSFAIPEIEIGICKDKESIYQKQKEYIENVFNVVPFEQSEIAPSWLKNISLVVIMHMEAFTGHIFHTYEKAYEDVKKLTKMIPGDRILVYFPGWAKIPYDTDPIAFYKWWRKGKNEHKVYLSPAYQFKLFQKVSHMEPKVMLKKDIDFVKSF